MDHRWRLVPGSMSSDRRRCRVTCDATGITVARIHPLRPVVVQLPCAGTNPRSTA